MATIFIRTLKCGTVSIHDVLTKKYAAFSLPPAEHVSMEMFRKVLDNETLVFCEPQGSVKLLAGLTPEERAKHSVVGFIRNPWDRFISGWAFSIRKGWVDPDTTPMQLLRGKATNPWICWLHVNRNQHESLYAADGSLVLTDVIRFEHLEDDFNVIRKKHGMELTPLPYVNRSNHDYWRTYFDLDLGLRNEFEKHFAWDLANLPYTYHRDLPTGELPSRIVTPIHLRTNCEIY